MIYRCSCGRSKSGSPYKASGVRRWLCNTCKEDIEKGRKPKFIKSLVKLRIIEEVRRRRAYE